tara:strand:+ start:8123 stop:9349 length:1227 start_codon:yes stop_codon:yes gene_type:complete
MKILTTNSAGNDVFGGIHIRKMEQIKYSPQHKFHVIELNSEKKYITKDNFNLHRLNKLELTNNRGVFQVLKDSDNLENFNVRVEKLVNEYQKIIGDVDPDVVLIPGTSLTSYFLWKGCKREGVLDRSLQEYAGVLEKEIGNYSGDSRYILQEIGKKFVNKISLEKMTYLFPSKICKNVVEGLHNISFDSNRSNIVWNGVSEEFLKGGFKRKVPKKLTLGYVGRLQHVKNLPFLFNLKDNLIEQGIIRGHDSLELKIITDISEAHGKSIGGPLLEKMNSGEIYYFHPRSRSELKKFYEKELSSGIVSSFFETFCNGAVESLVCGTPTFLSDMAGAKEVYDKYGLSDLVFSNGEINSFKKALKSAEKRNFVIEEKLSREIGEDLSWEKVIGKYNQIIEGIAERAGRNISQ